MHFASSMILVWIITCNIIPPDNLVAACFAPLHQRGDSGSPLHPCKQLGNHQGPAAETCHNSWVYCLKIAIIAVKFIWRLDLHTVCVYFRVLLANPKELIEMQMRNDSTGPRSSITFYEKYHSLEDVCFLYHIPALCCNNIVIKMLLFNSMA